MLSLKSLQRQVGKVENHVSARVTSIESFTDDIECFLEDFEDTPLNDSVRSDIEMAVQGIRDQLNQLI